jgi:hypothetical protein
MKPPNWRSRRAEWDRHIAEMVMGYAVHEYRKDEGWAAAIADIEPDDYPLIVLAESTIMQRLW